MQDFCPVNFVPFPAENEQAKHDSYLRVFVSFVKIGVTIRICVTRCLSESGSLREALPVWQNRFRQNGISPFAGFSGLRVQFDFLCQKVIEEGPYQSDAEQFDQAFYVGIDSRVQNVGRKLEFERHGKPAPERQFDGWVQNETLTGPDTGIDGLDKAGADAKSPKRIPVQTVKCRPVERVVLSKKRYPCVVSGFLPVVTGLGQSSKVIDVPLSAEKGETCFNREQTWGF